MERARGRWGLLLRLLPGLLALALFTQILDLDLLRAALVQPAARGWLALGVVAYAVSHLAGGLAWRGLVATPGRPLPMTEVLRLDLGSGFWSTVLPGAVAGELIKGVRLAGRGHAPVRVAHGLLVGRLCSVGMASVLGGLGAWATPSLGSEVQAAAMSAFGGLLAAALGGLAVVNLGSRALRHLPWLAGGGEVQAEPMDQGAEGGPAPLRNASPGVWPAPPDGGTGRAAFVTRVRDATRRALVALVAAPPPSPGRLARSALAAGTMHALLGGMYVCVFKAAGATIPLPTGMALSSLSAIAESLPISVGGYGVRELVVTALATPVVGAAPAAVGALALAVPVTTMLVAGGLVEALQSIRSRASR